MHGRIWSRNTTTLLLITSLAFNFGLCLAMVVRGHAEPVLPSRSSDGKTHRERLASELKLTPEQSNALEASREQFFEQLRPIKQRLHDESDILAGLLTAPELDMAAVSVQVEKVAAVRNDIQWQMIQHLLSMRETLKPEQLELFKDFASRVLSRAGHSGRHGSAPSEREGCEGSAPKAP